MADRADITPELCRQLLRYEPETGRLFWHERSINHFRDNTKHTAQRMCLMWNSKLAGKEAFLTLKTDGYLVGAIFDISFRAHRVAWAIQTGEWPVDQIDHINGSRADNRWDNLREVNDAENGVNKARSSRNKSGCTGVRWHEHRGYWEAFITRKRRFITVGCFQNLDDAVEARKQAERDMNFHPNHDRALT